MKLEMASSHGSDSPANTNHFFKIILSDTDSQTKLMIPRKFVTKYGKDLDSRISLKVPNGLVWQVNLERHEGEVWLQDGWSQFSRFYSIQFGHLLVFKYQGHSDFKVRIFDPSSTEIDYPSSTSAKLDMMRKRAIETDHLTSSDLIRPCKKTVRKLALKDANHNGVCLMPKLQKEKTKLGDCWSAIKEARATALASAEAFKSDNPFFFKAMKISYVDGKSRGLIVSKAFEESYKRWKDNDLVHLQVAGKIWPVNCDKKWNKCWLRFGWDRFAADNSLTVDDVCVFELTDSCRKLLQVLIFRATKEITENVKCELASKMEEDKALACAKAFKSENPFFILTMKPHLISVRGRPYVPKTFKEAYENWKHNDQIVLQVAGTTSTVYCTVKLETRWFRIIPGWGVFAQDNSLNVGDVCVFELIIPSTKLFHVSIFRATDQARLLTSKAVMS